MTGRSSRAITRPAGSASASPRFFAVGALCPPGCGRPRRGARQALPNPALRQRTLALLREGVAAPAAASMAMAMDEGRDHRQLHLVDRHGRTGAFSGGACVDWCGHRAAENVSVRQQCWPAGGGRGHAREPIGGRRPTAGRAAARGARYQEAAGGDKRGRQSAALLVQGHEPYPRSGSTTTTNRSRSCAGCTRSRRSASSCSATRAADRRPPVRPHLAMRSRPYIERGSAAGPWWSTRMIAASGADPHSSWLRKQAER